MPQIYWTNSIERYGTSSSKWAKMRAITKSQFLRAKSSASSQHDLLLFGRQSVRSSTSPNVENLDLTLLSKTEILFIFKLEFMWSCDQLEPIESFGVRIHAENNKDPTQGNIFCSRVSRRKLYLPPISTLIVRLQHCFMHSKFQRCCWISISSNRKFWFWIWIFWTIWILFIFFDSLQTLQATEHWARGLFIT
jgi:hypothetical protein